MKTLIFLAVCLITVSAQKRGKESGFVKLITTDITGLNGNGSNSFSVSSESSNSESSSSEHSRKIERQHFYKKSECDHFKSFLKRHKKSYNASANCNDLNDVHAENFKANNLTINEHNKRFEAGNETYFRRISIHSDLDPQEKEEQRMGLIPKATSRNLPVVPVVTNLPVRVDWRSNLGPVKDQGTCGCCWTFAAVAVCDYVSRSAGVTTVCSEQSIMDCVVTSQSHGCAGKTSSLILFAILKYFLFLAV